MKTILKALSILMLVAMMVFISGCSKSSASDDVNPGNNGGGNSGGGANAGNITVTTYNPTSVSSNEATCGVKANPDDINYLEEIGVCWGTSAYPTISNNKKSTGNCGEPFICSVSNLQPETIYHVRGYALYDSRYYYGDDKRFTTLPNGGGGGGGNIIVPTGATNGLFSVSANKHVFFSQGNLQYRASTKTWKFADNQWDFIGEENSNISSTYSRWIDLFCWGTSGYNHGAICYQPYSTSELNRDYWAYGSATCDLNDETGQADWGYNKIVNGGNSYHQWRTLTKDEWIYVLERRSTISGIRYAKAIVNNKCGVIILPDNWISTTYNLNEINKSDANYSSNIISLSQWETLEIYGVVFLPAAGCRYRTDYGANEFGFPFGRYWSATNYMGANACYCLRLRNDYLETYLEYRMGGSSVRLVQDYQ